MINIDVKNHNWLVSEPLSGIMKAIAAHGGEARIVGGAVRDLLLGRDVNDVDLAINIPPQQAQAALELSGYRIIPTGIDFGTIMVVCEGQSFEVTSLRRDIETDGRHAHVTFTDSWEEDAQRRDFTINGLYLDGAGTIYDFVGGLSDIKNKKLRFIGMPEERIGEDVLRILRYFRFLSELGDDVALDTSALRACGDLAKLLPTLSAERIWQELSRLLVGVAAWRSVRLMRDEKLWPAFLPAVNNFSRYEKLLEQSNLSPILCLAALINDVDNQLLLRLRLSKKEEKLLRQYVALAPVIRDVPDSKALRQIIYDEGDHPIRGALQLALAEGADRANMISVLAQWENPLFPLRGKDLQDRGVENGPEMGQILFSLEAWWRREDFKPTRAACLARLDEELNEG